MKALSIKNPYAFNIVSGDKTIEYRTWVPKETKEFLLVSSSSPSPYDFGIGLPHGYAMAIIKITSVSEHKNKDGNYEWHVEPQCPVNPIKVKGKLHFYDVADDKITLRTDLVDSMRAYLKDSESQAGQKYVEEYLDKLCDIGYDEMPKKYQKILAAYPGDWEKVADVWMNS